MLLLEAVANAGRPPFVDWLVYRGTVERGLGGLSLFDPRQLSGVYSMPDIIETGSTYPPVSILPLLPFSIGLGGLLAWLLVSFGLFLTGLWAALRRDLGSHAPIAFAFALLGLLVFLPFASGVITANVNIAIAGIYAWCWAVGRSDGRVGILAGIGAAFKLFPSVLALWPTGRARRRSIGFAIAVFASLTLMSLPIVGVESWYEFAAALSNARPHATTRASRSLAYSDRRSGSALLVSVRVGNRRDPAPVRTEGQERPHRVRALRGHDAGPGGRHASALLAIRICGLTVVLGGLPAAVDRRSRTKSQAVAATPAERAATAAAPSS